MRPSGWRTLRAVRRLPLLLVLLAVVAVLLPPAGALADGDPPSDVLITNQLYTPVTQKISAPVLAELKSTIDQANKGGFKVRVALVLDANDLGSVPQLLGHPVEYVKLLSGELYYSWKGAIVAVQPTGIGVQNIKPLAPAQALADTIAIKNPSTADGLGPAPDRHWQLWRQDDDGSQELLVARLTERDATCRRDSLSERGQAQTYWITSTVDPKS